jgi:hypothetical protein
MLNISRKYTRGYKYFFLRLCAAVMIVSFQMQSYLRFRVLLPMRDCCGYDIVVSIRNLFLLFPNPVKKLSVWAVNNRVTEKIDQAEVKVNKYFVQWYRQILLNVIIVVILILSGLIMYLFSDTTGVLKLLVAVAWIFSIAVFIRRRIRNVQTFVTYRNSIVCYGRIIIQGLFHHPPGRKVKETAYDIYMKLYQENVSEKKALLHRIASKLSLVPSQREVFELIYKKMLSFFQNVLYRKLIQFVIFGVLFAALSLFVKNTVLLEMHFNSLFSTIEYPYRYFKNLLIIIVS